MYQQSLTTTDPVSHNETAAIRITTAALQYFEQAIAKRGGGSGIRLSVTPSKDCYGYKYQLEIIDTFDPLDYSFKINDNFTISVTPESYVYTQGTEIDYVREGINKVIKYNNPNTKGTCGCGESVAF